MPTPDIFDFDTEGLEDYDADRVSAALMRHPMLYVNHLRVARQIAKEAAELEREQQDSGDQSYDAGYVAGLRAVAARLRKGDFTPKGALPQEDDFSGGRFKAR